MSSILIKNGTIVTMNKNREIIKGDVYISDGVFKKIGNTVNKNAEVNIDATNKIVIPGFIQTHVHLCQTLFRGQANDLELLDWLYKRVLPLEAAHDHESIYWSALLGCAELIRGGTTCILDMASVRYTEKIFEAVNRAGIRAIIGKSMLDTGCLTPQELVEDTESSLDESIALLERWHGYNDNRIQYALSPRFALGCSESLLSKIGTISRQYGVLIHTHAAETKNEVNQIAKLYGRKNVKYLHELGLTGTQSLFAHCIWLDDEELQILKDTDTRVVHCPTSNLKLASGIAKIPQMLETGICVSLGADGAACNNNLDMFEEMKHACLIQKVIHGADVMPAYKAFELATIEAAKALGMDNQIGSIELGKKADLAILNPQKCHSVPLNNTDIYSKLVYESKSLDIEFTIVEGQILMSNNILLTINEQELIEACEITLNRLLNRVKLQ